MEPIDLLGEYGLNPSTYLASGGSPIFGAQSPQQIAQLRVNVLHEPRPDGDKTRFIVKPVPQWALLGAISVSGVQVNGYIRGFIAVDDNRCLAVVGTSLYTCFGSIASWTLVAGATISGASGTSYPGNLVNMVSNGVQVLIVGNGVQGSVYTLQTGSYQQAALNTAGSWGLITDANFTGLGATSADWGIGYLSGRATVNTGSSSGGNQTLTSGSFDFTAWGANSAISPLIINTPSDRPGALVRVYSYHDVLVFFGDKYIEFWQNVGGYPDPYARIPGTTQDFGLVSFWSVATVKNTLYFLARDPNGTIFVARLNGYTVERVSTPDIDNMFNNNQQNVTFEFQDMVAVPYVSDGHHVYRLSGQGSFGTVDTFTVAYDVLSGLWHFEASDDYNVTTNTRDLGQIPFQWRGQSCATINSNTQATFYTASQPGKPGSTFWGSYFNTAYRVLTTRHIHNWGDDVQIERIEVDMAVGPSNGINVDITLEVSRDGGVTFETARSGSASYSTANLTNSTRQVVQWRRIGQAKQFVFRFKVTQPISPQSTGYFLINYARAYAPPAPYAMLTR